MKLILRCEEECKESLELDIDMRNKNMRDTIKRKATEKGWFLSTATGIVLCSQHNR